MLGDGAPPHVVAALAGVAIGELAPARDALRAAGLLAAGGARFAHGLIAAAIVEDLTRTERERLHREAARAAGRRAARAADAVAAHLLECGPHGDPEVSEPARRAPPRRRAARRAARGRRATSSARCEERAPGDDRGRHARAARRRPRSTPGCPTRARRLHEALREPDDASAASTC